MRVLKGIVAFIMILLFSCGFSIFAYSTWFDHRKELKSDAFNDDLSK